MSAEPAGTPAADADLTEGAEPDGAEPAATPRRRGFFGELPVLMLIAFVLALLLKAFLVQAFFIPSSSMEPTLLEGDRVLVNKVVYDVREPRRGEVVVFTQRVPELDPAAEPVGITDRITGLARQIIGVRTPGERDFIKRIIGLPGEMIEYRDGVIYIDDEPLPEAPTTEGGYLSMPDNAPFGPVQVPDGHYFMMGDNRPNSADSRFPDLGPIPGDDIVGRAFVKIWPVDRLGLLRPWEYDSPLPLSWTVPLPALRPAA